MNLDAFRADLLTKRPQLEAWGRFVQQTILDRVTGKSVSMQISSHRPKDIDSAIGKISRKGYDAPLEQMTDLVGVRFVVLISPQVQSVADVIEASDLWDWSLDRDWEQEVESAPETFGYQSRHYVVRARAGCSVHGVAIDPRLPCEIQIRTIMQHAYAEMMHDTIYKPNSIVPPKAKRFAASSMALIETADHLFCETMRLLEEENRPRMQLWKELAGLYAAQVNSGFGYDERLNMEVLNQFPQYLGTDVISEIRSMIHDWPMILERIRLRLNNDPFWLQPTALFAYWLVRKNPRHAFPDWPYASAHDALSLIYSDLGISLGRKH